jgi:hypothetical protein
MKKIHFQHVWPETVSYCHNLASVGSGVNLIPHITILVHSKYIHCIISFASFIVESGVKNHKNDKPPPLVVCEKISSTRDNKSKHTTIK